MYIVLLIIFIYLLYNYYKLTGTKINHFQKLLIFIRFIILGFLFILFIDPNILHSSTKKRTVDLIIDNSKSMGYNSDFIYKSIDKIFTWGDENSINFNYYLFGNNFRKISDINEIDFTDDYTSFSDFFNNFNTNNDIFLFSDGINNHGLNNFNYEGVKSVNIIGFGDNLYSDFDISIVLIDTLIYTDSIRIDLMINKNIINQNISGDIYLNNNIINQQVIGSYYLNELNNQTISLSLSLDDFEEFNTIFINNSEQESNYTNNSFNLILDNGNHINSKLLIVSGAISQNTSFIKNFIKTNLYNYDINHLYRINQSMWNKPIENFDFNSYDLVVLDDFPIYNTDSKFLSNYIQKSNNKILYFLGPSNFENNYILDYCGCNYLKLDKNILNKNNEDIYYNNEYYHMQPNQSSFNINCKNNEIFIYNNGNSFITINDNIISFLIPNMNDFSLEIPNKDLLFNDLLLSIIDNEVYNNNRLLEIFSNSNNINLANQLAIHIKHYKKFSDESLFINIYKNNSLYKRLNNFQEIKSDYFIGDLLFDNSGDYLVQADLISNNTKVLSNILNISVNKIDYEFINKGINMELLSIISNNNDGIFYKYTDIKEFLENIEISNVNNVNYTEYDFRNYSYLLILLILLLSIEWYVRNKVGLV
jgi:hypothetical protein